MPIEQLLEAATAEHRAGNNSQARQFYQHVLTHQPDHPLAHFRYGLLEFQEGHLEQAHALISRAVAACPHDGSFQFGLGEVLTAMKCWDEAVAAYRQVTQDHPRFADANFAIGVALQSEFDYAGAISAYQTAVHIQPDHAAAMSNLGTVLQVKGRSDEALRMLRAATALEPDVVDHAINLAAALFQQRQFGESETVSRSVLAREPDNVPATYNLGNALQGVGKLREAAEQFHLAILLRPDHADAMVNLGNVCKELGDFKQAADSYESALRVQPGLVSAINNAGCLLRTTGRLEEAEATLRRGLAMHPQHATLHDSLGNVLKDAGRLDEAIECFRTAIALDPTAAVTHSNLVYSLSFAATDATPILEESRRWDVLHAKPLRSQMQIHLNDRSLNRRLRIGYVSSDFREHCQSFFTIPLLSHHDHTAVEIFCYSSVERSDSRTHGIKSFADVWRDVRTLDDEQLSDLVRADRIDILVDLTMHMADGRPLLFARKPAPVQIAWLAYPGTTGITAMDYRFSDPRLDPVGFESHYTERTIHLPDSFWCYDPLSDQLEANDLPALWRNYITLGCLNNPCKLTDHTLGLWGGVMRGLQDSRLVLMTPSGSYRQLLLSRLAAHGVAARRVTFVSYRPRAEYLRTYHQIDLGLDTFPYNGHTTSLDSFWMGVPVVTRTGKTCVGRGGLSQLYQLGLSELASDNDADFIATAIHLAQDLPRLASLRGQLRNRLTQSRLMDGKRFARNIEAAYRQAWDNYCRNN